MPAFKISPLCLLAALLLAAPAVRATDFESLFRAPPAAARPWVFWYWMQGAVSQEAITADLDAMQRAGLGGATLFTISPPANPPIYSPVARPLTPEWWALVRHAALEADRRQLELGFAIGDGFATAGGPWITPELAMQKLVWSETFVEGGQPLATPLAIPPTQENFYRDVAVLAFPAPTDAGAAPSAAAPKVTTNLPGFDAQFLAAPDGVRQLRTDAPCWIQFEYAAPFTLRSLTIRQWDHNYGGVYHATRLRLEASDDGVAFRAVTRLEPSRHGWQDWDADYTFALAPTTARFFRFTYDPAGAEPGSEDLDGAKWKPRLVLRGLQLSAVPRLPGFEGKSGAVWRRSARGTGEQLPSPLCVPRDRILDLTARLGPDGRLDWTPPPGRWQILRLGHTATGHRNETATAARGLECDKLNPAAVRLQFDNWFGEIVRQLGPDLAGRVLKIFHVDSWEAGSQNWTPAFREEFQRRRGYDPLPLLPAMAGVPVGSAAESEQFLADVRQTIADLTNENFFGTLATLAHERGCVFSAEPSAPTMTGDSLAAFAAVDVPMGEFWLRSPTHDKPNDIADAVSGAHLYGKPIVQAEAFTALRQTWDEHPGLLKPLADRQLALGINRFVLHVFAHNPWLDRRPGMVVGGVGTYFQRDQTWWPEARVWTDYLARCSALLQHGRPVADVAYFTGEDLPSRAVLPERRSSPLPAGYTADSINPDALLRLARIEDGQLVLPGGARYSALVLPHDDAPPSSALAAKLRACAALTVLPGDSLAGHLDRNRLAPDLLAHELDGSDAASLVWTHRSAPDAEIYFLSNQLGTPRALRLSLRVDSGTPQLWQPVTGEIVSAHPLTHRAGRTEFAVDLDPSGSLFVIFRRDAQPPSPAPATAPSRPGASLALVATLSAPWSVRFSPALGAPPAAVAFPDLLDWTQRPEPEIKFFSGTATYRTDFHWDAHSHPSTSLLRRTWLDLGAVANLARVRVNGRDCGVAWTPPYRVEITAALRAGPNELEITVTNTWNNRLVGDRTAPPVTGPVTWTTAAARDGAPLLPAGLLGPVRLFTGR